MRYDNVCPAVFVRRNNRFTAEVLLGEQEITVHVKNTGRLRELLLPGADVILTQSNNANRRTAYDLIGAYRGGKLYNIDSQAPNAVTFEWLRTRGFDEIRPETVCGSSRIDFWMRRGDVTYLLEVKGCTLEEGGVGYFPDAPTERGIRHLNTLSRAAEEGIRAGIAFVICMKGVDRVLPNDRTQPAFGQALLRAKQAGVTVWFLKTDPKPDALFVTGAERDNS